MGVVNEHAVWHFVCASCGHLHHAGPREVRARRDGAELTCYVPCPACGHERVMPRVPQALRRRLEQATAPRP